MEKFRYPPYKNMPEKYANPYWLNQASVFMITIGLTMLGLIARILLKDEPINWRKFAGELILAGIGGITLWAAGMLQELPLFGMLLMAGLSGLGGVKALELGGQVWVAISKARNGG